MPEAETTTVYRPTLTALALWGFTEFLGWAGAFLVVYALITWMTSEPWPVVERHAPFISSLLTLLGTALTAASVYFHSPKARAPWHHSKYVALVVIVSALVAIAVLIMSGKLSQVAVSGFGMLAIAGGLKRLLAYPPESTGAVR
jgi:hypothetical protein